MNTRDVLKQLLDGLVNQIVEAEEMELPKWRFDGEEVTTPEEVAAILGITRTEAKARMDRAGFPTARAETKDVHGAEGASALQIGVGTVKKRGPIYQRACALAYKRRKKRKKE